MKLGIIGNERMIPHIITFLIFTDTNVNYPNVAQNPKFARTEYITSRWWYIESWLRMLGHAARTAQSMGLRSIRVIYVTTLMSKLKSTTLTMT